MLLLDLIWMGVFGGIIAHRYGSINDESLKWVGHLAGSARFGLAMEVLSFICRMLSAPLWLSMMKKGFAGDGNMPYSTLGSSAPAHGGYTVYTVPGG